MEVPFNREAAVPVMLRNPQVVIEKFCLTVAKPNYPPHLLIKQPDGAAPAYIIREM